MKSARGTRVNSPEVTASQLAARHRRPAPKRRPRGPEPARRASRRRRPSPPAVPPQVGRAVRAGLAIGLAVAIVVGVVGAYQAFAGSRLFALRQVELQGAVHASRDELMRVLRRSVAGGLWQADLGSLRNELERHAWVRDAEVARVLPDTLRVTISERQPFALARRPTGGLVWVDRDGVVLGERSMFKAEAVLPLITGLAEGGGEEVAEANRQRLSVYQQLLSELDGGQPPLSEMVDEVNLSDGQDARLRLADRRVTVMVGDRDYRARLGAALKVLDAIERKDLSALGLLKVTDAERLVKGGRVAYLNATRPDRVIVGLAQ